jgi:type II secretory pathway pseudopilin PulG
MNRNIPNRQHGAALVVGLIMLVLITIMLLSAVVLSTSNFRSVSNMQFREEAIAAANRAIDDVISSPFTNSPQSELIDVDIDSDGDTDYVVQIDTPVCISATEAFGADPSSLSLPPAMTVASTWNTVWDIRATVAADGTVTITDAGGEETDVAVGNAGGAAVVVRAGVRALLSDAQKETVCT